jgi:hypothetical protein
MRNISSWILILILLCAGCSQSPPTPKAEPNSSTIATAPSPTPTPNSPWYIQDPEVNPIDNSKTQFFSVESVEGKQESHYVSGIGSIPIHKSTAKIVLCFHNGKLCGSPSVGARVDIDGFVSTDGSVVRLKYDDGQPVRQHWAGTDSHNALFPYGHEKQFFSSLLSHKKLYFEFSKYEEAPQVVTFDVTGLAEAMDQSGLKPQ